MYKGVLAPLIGNSFAISIFFGFNNVFKNLMQNYYDNSDKDLPNALIFISAAMGAAV